MADQRDYSNLYELDPVTGLESNVNAVHVRGKKGRINTIIPDIRGSIDMESGRSHFKDRQTLKVDWTGDIYQQPLTEKLAEYGITPEPGMTDADINKLLYEKQSTGERLWRSFIAGPLLSSIQIARGVTYPTVLGIPMDMLQGVSTAITGTDKQEIVSDIVRIEETYADTWRLKFAEDARKKKEQYAEALPIYTDPGKAPEMFDSGWWYGYANNSIQSLIGFGLPMGMVGKGVQAAFGTNLLRSALSGINPLWAELTKELTAGIITNQLEGNFMANDVYFNIMESQTETLKKRFDDIQKNKQEEINSILKNIKDRNPDLNVVTPEIIEKVTKEVSDKYDNEYKNLYADTKTQASLAAESMKLQNLSMILTDMLSFRGLMKGMGYTRNLVNSPANPFSLKGLQRGLTGGARNFSFGELGKVPLIQAGKEMYEEMQQGYFQVTNEMEAQMRLGVKPEDVESQGVKGYPKDRWDRIGKLFFSEQNWTEGLAGFAGGPAQRIVTKLMTGAYGSKAREAEQKVYDDQQEVIKNNFAFAKGKMNYLDDFGAALDAFRQTGNSDVIKTVENLAFLKQVSENFQRGTTGHLINVVKTEQAKVNKMTEDEVQERFGQSKEDVLRKISGHLESVKDLEKEWVKQSNKPNQAKLFFLKQSIKLAEDAASQSSTDNNIAAEKYLAELINTARANGHEITPEQETKAKEDLEQGYFKLKYGKAKDGHGEKAYSIADNALKVFDSILEKEKRREYMEGTKVESDFYSTMETMEDLHYGVDKLQNEYNTSRSLGYVYKLNNIQSKMQDILSSNSPGYVFSKAKDLRKMADNKSYAYLGLDEVAEAAVAEATKHLKSIVSDKAAKKANKANKTTRNKKVDKNAEKKEAAANAKSNTTTTKTQTRKDNSDPNANDISGFGDSSFTMDDLTSSPESDELFNKGMENLTAEDQKAAAVNASVKKTNNIMATISESGGDPEASPEYLDARQMVGQAIAEFITEMVGNGEFTSLKEVTEGVIRALGNNENAWNIAEQYFDQIKTNYGNLVYNKRIRSRGESIPGADFTQYLADTQFDDIMTPTQEEVQEAETDKAVAKDQTKDNPSIDNEEKIAEEQVHIDNTISDINKSKVPTGDGKTFIGRRIQSAYNAMAFLSRKYEAIRQGFQYLKREVSDALNDMPDKSIHSIHRLKVGDALTVEINDDDTAKVYNILDEKRKTTITWGELKQLIGTVYNPVTHAKRYEQEILRNTPMVIKDKDGIIVAHIHSTNWINEENISGDVENDSSKNYLLRQHIQQLAKDGKVFHTQVTERSLGQLFKAADSQSRILSDMMPGPVIFAVFRKGTLQMGKGISFNKPIINDTTKFVEGVTYTIHEAKLNGTTGETEYIAIPVNGIRLSDHDEAEDGSRINHGSHVVLSVMSAIEAHIKGRERLLDSGEIGQRLDQFAKHIQDTIGLNIYEPKHLRMYLEMFLHNHNIGGEKSVLYKQDNNYSLVEGYLNEGGAGESIHETKFLFAMHGNQIEMSYGKGLSYVFTGQGIAAKQSDEEIANTLNKMRKMLLMTGDHAAFFSSNLAALEGDTKIPYMKKSAEGKVEFRSEKYTDFMRGVHRTNVMSVNVGTEEKPAYSIFIQPVIKFDTTGVPGISELDAEAQVKANEKAKEEAKAAETEVKIETKEEVKKADEPKSDAELEYEKIMQGLAGTTVKMNGTVTEVPSNNVKANISDVTSEQIDKTLSSVSNSLIRSLSAFKQNQIVSYLVAKACDLAMVRSAEKKAKVSSTSAIALKEVYDAEKAMFQHDLEKYQIVKENLLAFLEGKDDSVKGIGNMRKNLYSTSETVNNLQSLLDNWDKIISITTDTLNTVEGFRVASGNTSNSDTEAQYEEDGDTNVSEEYKVSKGQTFDDYASLSYDPKDVAAPELRRLLHSIKKREKDGKLYENYLGLNQAMDFREVYDTLRQELADINSDYNLMKLILSLKSEAYPWITELVEKLDAAPFQIKNQFVYNLTGNYLSMRMLIWNKRGDGNFTIQDVASNNYEEINGIKAVWEDNYLKKSFMQSVLEDGEDDAEYAEHVISGAGKEQIKLLYSLLQSTVTRGVEDPSLIVEFLDFFGIDITKKMAVAMVKGKYTYKGNSQTYRDMIMHPSGVLKKLYDTVINAGDSSIESDWKRYPVYLPEVGALARFASAFGTRKYSNSHRSGGRTVQVYSKNRFVSVRTREIKDIEYSYIKGDRNMIDNKSKVILEALKKKHLSPRDQNNNNALEPYKYYRKVEEGEIVPTRVVDEKGRVVVDGYTVDTVTLSKIVQNRTKDEAGNTVVTETVVEEETKVTNAPKRVATSPYATELLKDDYSKGASWIQEMLLRDSVTGKLRYAENKLVVLDEKSVTLNNLSTWTASLEALKNRWAKTRKNADMVNMAMVEIEIFKMGELMSSSTNLADRHGRVIKLLYLTTSDKKTVFGLNVMAFDFGLDLNTGELTDDTLNKLYDQLVLPDLTRMSKYQAAKKISVNGSHRTGYNIESFDKGASKFLLMPDLNNMPGMFDPETGLLMPDIQTAAKKKEIKTFLQERVQALVEQKLELWNDFKIGVTKEDGTTINSFLDESYLKNVAKGNTHEQKDNTGISKVRWAATDLVLQYLVGNANIFQLYIGDPAIYYKSTVEDVVRKRVGDITNELTSEELYAKHYTAEERIKEARDIADNIGKRLAADIAPRNEIADSDSDRPIYRQGFMQDIRVTARGFKELQERLKKYGDSVAAPYERIKSADGQEYATWQESLWIKWKMGELEDSDYKRVYDIFSIQEEELDRTGSISEKTAALSDPRKEGNKVFGGIMQPMKPVATGMVKDSRSSINTRYYIKSSTIALLPVLVAGTELDNLRKVMKNNKLDRLAFSSAVKNGNVATPVKVFDDKGRVLPEAMKENYFYGDDTVVNPDGNVKLDSYRDLRRRYFGIQLEIPFDEVKNAINRVTQASKQLFVNILDEEGFVYGGRSDWNGRDLQTEYYRLYGKLFAKQKADFEAKVLGEDGKVDKGKLKKILKDEARDRSYPLPEQQMLDMDDYIDHIAFSPSADKFESLLNSLVSNAILKTKMRGKSFIAVSDAGVRIKALSLEEGKTETAPYGGIAYIKNIDGPLDRAHTGKDGKVHPAQIVIPWKFADEQGNLLDMNKFIKDGKLDTTKLPKEVFEMLLMRIPGQGLNSMIYAEVVGFSPAEAGDIIIGPAEFVAQTGMDFDIDKIYSYIYNTRYGLSTKNPQYEELSAELNNINEQLKAFKAVGLEDRLEYQTIVDTIRNASQQLSETDKADTETIKVLRAVRNDAYESLYNLYKELGISLSTTIEKAQGRRRDIKDQHFVMEKIEGEETKAGLQNAIYDIHLAIMKNPSSLVQEMIEHPVDYWELYNEEDESRSIASDIGNLRKTNGKWNELETFTMLSDAYQSNKFKIATAGKDGVSIFSQDNTFNVLCQRITGKEKERLQIRVPLKSTVEGQSDATEALQVNFGKVKSEGYIDDAQTLPGAGGNAKRRYKSFIITGYQSASVDNEKLQVLGILNINPTTASIIKVLNALGFAEEVPYFIAQDIIVDYVKELAKIKSSVNDYTKDAALAAAEIVRAKIEYATEEYTEEKAPANRQRFAQDEATIENMRNYIAQGENAPNYKLAQQAFLDQFLYLVSVGESLSNVQNAVSIDSKGYGKTLIASAMTEERVANVLAEKDGIVNSHRFFGKRVGAKSYMRMSDEERKEIMAVTISSTKGDTIRYFKPDTISGHVMFHAVMENNALWGDFFPFYNNAVSQTFKEIEGLLRMGRRATSFKIDYRRKIYNAMKAFVYSDDSHGLFTGDPSVERKRLLFEYTNLPMRVSKFAYQTPDVIEKIKKGERNAIMLTSTQSKYITLKDGVGYAKIGGDYYKLTYLAGGEEGATYAELLAEAKGKTPTFLKQFLKDEKPEDFLRNWLDPEAPKELSAKFFKIEKEKNVEVNLPLAFLINDLQNDKLMLDKGNGQMESYKDLNKFIGILNAVPMGEGTPSLIKMMAGEKDDPVLMTEAYLAFLNMITDDIPLNLEFNGIDYTSRRLAQELIIAVYLSGGMQQAIQYTKIVPSAFLEAIGFLGKVSNVFKDGSFPIIGDPGMNYWAVTPFIQQFMQHYPEDVPSRLNEDLSQIRDTDGNVMPSNTDMSKVMQFQMDPESDLMLKVTGSATSQYPVFVTYYNKSGGKNNRYLLYKYNGDNYVRIPTLGMYGMWEYNAKVPLDAVQNSLLSSKQIENYTLPVATSRPPAGTAVAPKAEKTKIEERKQASKLNMETLKLESTKGGGNAMLASTVNAIIDTSISKTKVEMAKYLKHLLPVIPLKLNIIVKEFAGPDDPSDSGYYDPENNTLFITEGKNGKHFVYEDLVTNILHEIIHAVTAKAITLENASQETREVIAKMEAFRQELRNEILKSKSGKEFKAFEKAVALSIEKNDHKLLNTYSPEERKRLVNSYYGLYSLDEFVSNFFTREAFRDYLNTLHNPGYEQGNWFKRFIELVQNLLKSLTKGYKKGSTSKDAAVMMIDFLETLRPERRKGVPKENESDLGYYDDFQSPEDTDLFEPKANIHTDENLGMSLGNFMKTLSKEAMAKLRQEREEGIITIKCK